MKGSKTEKIERLLLEGRDVADVMEMTRSSRSLVLRVHQRLFDPVAFAQTAERIAQSQRKWNQSAKRKASQNAWRKKIVEKLNSRHEKLNTMQSATAQERQIINARDEREKRTKTL